MNCRTRLGSRFTGTGDVNYFRYGALSAEPSLIPAYTTYAVLTGRQTRIFSERHPAGPPDRARPSSHQAGRGRRSTPAPGQFLASRADSDFPFNPAGCETATPFCLTEFRRPASATRAITAGAVASD